MKYHCFFEQSGTFKNEFKKLGYEAYDYDILNDFNETDYQIDLFKEIENAYDNKESIFDKFNKDEDFIIAFFPCVRFEEQILLHFRGEASVQKKKMILTIKRWEVWYIPNMLIVLSKNLYYESGGKK